MDKLVPMVSAAAPIFVYDIEFYLTLAILVVMLVIEIVAFVNCITQRADAFPVVGSLSKATWLAILGGSTLLSVLCIQFGSSVYLAFLLVTPALIYLLDVRPALRDAINGTGSW